MPGRDQILRVVADLEELERAGAGELARLVKMAGARGPVSVLLSGGRTPRGLYARLALPPYRDLIPWSALHLFWGDERHVPPDHPDSNYRAAREALLSKAPIPDRNVHRVPAENPDAGAAARDYEATLRSFFSLPEGKTPRFNLALLGIGTDGHTASLFPGSDALHDSTHLVAAPWIAALGAHRITVTPRVPQHATTVVVLASGADKAEALRRALAPDGSIDDCPARLLREARGNVTFIADRAAASLCRPGRV